MSTSTPFADIPPVIVDMLRDEATLSVAINVLEDSRRDNLTRTEDIHRRKPALGGILASKKDRDDYQAALKNAQIQLSSIDALIARASRARERIQPMLRIALIQHLSERDPSHRQGLRASRFHEHWHRCHAIVTDRLKGFLRDLREASAALSDDLKNNRPRVSSNTTWKLTTARTAAAELERAIGELNATAQDHATAVAHTPFAASTLPIVDSWDCIRKMDTILARPPADAVADAARMLTEFTDIHKPALDTLEGRFKAATVEHTHLAETSLRARWSELLAYAEIHLVSDAELEPALADIERRLLESERARLNAQFNNQPFRHES